MSVFSPYKAIGTALRTYWKDYGGAKDLLSSPLFHLAIFITACSYRVWLGPTWTDVPLSVLPNLLGFSLGAYALIFSLAGETLMLALARAKSEGGRPLLAIINATFLHFLMVQTVAIAFALAQKGSFVTDLAHLALSSPSDRRVLDDWLSGVAGFFGYLLTVYAVVLLVGAGLAVYRLANISGNAAIKADEARKEAEKSRR